LQILGVKPFAEPTINLFKQLACLGYFVLLLPHPCQAHSRAQFQRFGLLLLRDFNSFEKTGFGFTLGVEGQGSGGGN
jgi:hypothetical protein